MCLQVNFDVSYFMCSNLFFLKLNSKIVFLKIKVLPSKKKYKKMKQRISIQFMLSALNKQLLF